MDFATIQAQLAKLTSQLSQYAERTTMQSIEEIIQTTCVENRNNSNKMDIGSKKRSSITGHMNHHSHHKNLPNSIQGVENRNKEVQIQGKKTGELEKQFGQIMEFTAQIQEQSEFSDSTVENLKEDFEIHDAITLGSAMEVGGEPKTSKPSQNMDE
ncbi:hypothetical protein ACFX11_019532 [Malus domestica]